MTRGCRRCGYVVGADMPVCTKCCTPNPDYVPTDEELDAELAAHGVTPDMIKEAADKVKTALGLSVDCRNVWCALVGKCECPPRRS